MCWTVLCAATTKRDGADVARRNSTLCFGVERLPDGKRKRTLARKHDFKLQDYRLESETFSGNDWMPPKLGKMKLKNVKSAKPLYYFVTGPWLGDQSPTANEATLLGTLPP